MSRSELETILLNLRYDMDLIGESINISEELQNLTDTELLNLIAEYREERNESQ